MIFCPCSRRGLVHRGLVQGVSRLARLCARTAASAGERTGERMQILYWRYGRGFGRRGKKLARLCARIGWTSPVNMEGAGCAP